MGILAITPAYRGLRDQKKMYVRREKNFDMFETSSRLMLEIKTIFI